MKLTIKNIGPITQKSSIDLSKRFYVFVGYNNSGKTYMANLLANWLDTDFYGKKNFNFFDFDENTTQITLDENAINNFIQNKIKPALIESLPSLFNTNPEHFIFDKIELNLEGAYRDFLNTEIFCSFLYQKDIGNVKNYSTERLQIKKEYNSNNLILEIKNFGKDSLLARNEEEKRFNDYIGRIEWKNPQLMRGHNTSIVFFSQEAINEYLQNLFGSYFVNIFLEKQTMFFLPANRSFFPSFWKYIFSVEKENKERLAELLRKGENNFWDLIQTPYTSATNKLIQAIDGLDKGHYHENTEYQDLLNDVEQLLNGKIIVNGGREGIGRKEFKLEIKGQNNKKLDMYMASSSANQLTLLYLYFKYWAKKYNNFLIIDEPEENLHPENQIKLMKILMKFADRNDNRVLMTTHSNVITDVANNYIRLSYLKDKNVDTKDITQHIGGIAHLSHKDFGVYFFNGKSFKEYPIDEYGAYFKDFEEAAEKVRNVKDQLKEKIYYFKHPKKHQ
jgi:hypothetical protein